MMLLNAYPGAVTTESRVILKQLPIKDTAVILSAVWKSVFAPISLYMLEDFLVFHCSFAVLHVCFV